MILLKEDNGEGIEFNVFVYNVQPGIIIDYATGNSAISGEEVINTNSSSTSNSTNNNSNTTSNYTENSTSSSQNTTNNTSSAKIIIRGNSKSKIYHCPGQRDYENMADSEYLVNFNSENEAISAGYRKAKR